MTELPPAGWYDDPTSPVQERWWDGEKWSEQTRRKVVEEYVHRPGELRRVSDYLGHAFGLIRERWDDFLLIAALGAILSALAALFLLRPIVDAIDVVNNEIVGFEFPQFGLLFLFVVVSILIFAAAAMAQYKIGWEAVTKEPGSWSSALNYGLTNMSRLIGWGMVAAVPLIFVLAVMVGIAVTNAGAGALAAIVLFVGLFWWFVVISFLPVALVALERGTNPISASLSLVNRRWWRIFGRLILIAIIVGLLGNVVGAIFAQLVGSSDFFGISFVTSPEGNSIDIVKDLGSPLDFFVSSLATILLSYVANVGTIAGSTSIAFDVMERPDGQEELAATPEIEPY